MTTRYPRHARGAHAKRNPLAKLVTFVVVTVALIVTAPALFGLGLVLSVFWGWITRGMTKF